MMLTVHPFKMSQEVVFPRPFYFSSASRPPRAFNTIAACVRDGIALTRELMPVNGSFVSIQIILRREALSTVTMFTLVRLVVAVDMLPRATLLTQK